MFGLTSSVLDTLWREGEAKRVSSALSILSGNLRGIAAGSSTLEQPLCATENVKDSAYLHSIAVEFLYRCRTRRAAAQHHQRYGVCIGYMYGEC